MTNDFLLALQFWFQTAYNFLKSVYLPGTNVTPLAMLFFSAIVYISFKFISEILGTSTFRHSSDVGKITTRKNND